jgi:3-oxoadipate enol-lactonase
MAQTKWIESNGVSLRYQEEGAGDKTVVLIHEMGGTLESWDGVVPFLTDRYRVIRYDMRGFGLSEKIHGAFTLDDAIADLDGVLDVLGVNGPVALAGGAVGGGIALRMAAKRTEQVQALVAMAPATEIPPERQASAKAFPAKLAAMGIRSLVHDSTAPTQFPEVLRTDPKAFQRWISQQCANDPESYAATLLMLLDGVYAPYFDQIKCPTLVVAGEHDPGRQPEIVKPVADAIEGATFRVIKSGHYMAVQTPDLVGQMIADFLNDAGF